MKPDDFEWQNIGWYPEHSVSGSFRIFVVQHENWETPLFHQRCATIARLREALREAIVVARDAAGNPSGGVDPKAQGRR